MLPGEGLRLLQEHYVSCGFAQVMLCRFVAVRVQRVNGRHAFGFPVVIRHCHVFRPLPGRGSGVAPPACSWFLGWLGVPVASGLQSLDEVVQLDDCAADWRGGFALRCWCMSVVANALLALFKIMSVDLPRNPLEGVKSCRWTAAVAMRSSSASSSSAGSSVVGCCCCCDSPCALSARLFILALLLFSRFFAMDHTLSRVCHEASASLLPLLLLGPAGWSGSESEESELSTMHVVPSAWYSGGGGGLVICAVVLPVVRHLLVWWLVPGIRRQVVETPVVMLVIFVLGPLGVGVVEHVSTWPRIAGFSNPRPVGLVVCESVERRTRHRGKPAGKEECGGEQFGDAGTLP